MPRLDYGKSILYRSDPVGLSRARPPHASNSPLRPRSWSRFTRVLWLSVCFPALYTRAQVASHPGAACRQRPRPPRARGRHFPARWTTSAHARPPKPPILPLRSRAARGPESGLCMCPLPPQVPSSAGLDSPVAAATYHLCSVSLEVCGRRSKPFLLVTRTLNPLRSSSHHTLFLHAPTRQPLSAAHPPTVHAAPLGWQVRRRREHRRRRIAALGRRELDGRWLRAAVRLPAPDGGGARHWRPRCSRARRHVARACCGRGRAITRHAAGTGGWP